jgi:hypothetical protein
MQIDVEHNTAMVDNTTQPGKYDLPFLQSSNSTDGYINPNTPLTDPLDIEIGHSFTSAKGGFR